MLPDSPSPKIERTCPRCGLVFYSDKIDAMCPACLISNTLDSEDVDDGPAFWEEAPVKKPTPARTFSHFEILDELGRGGMGVVYRARDLNTERIVALKVLQAHHLDIPDLVLRFRSEVRAVSSLDHAYVLPIHEVGEYEGIPFFSMKLTTGGSLAQSIGNYRTKPREAAQLLAKVARGVQHAHERGILHRDLKPGNILLDAAGEPYVCDFGLAKWIEDDQKLTVTAAVLGTPHYIAPEQALGSKALTTAVDIYSLGAILYELLTGRPPFLGATVLETLVASQEKIPDRPSSIAKNVPADLETICLKALEHSPGSRYATAGAFADDLENWLAGRPINARPVNAAEQLWRWAKRNPLPALLVVALFGTLVTIAVGATLAAVNIDRARQRAVTAEKEAIKSESKAKEDLFQSSLAQARASRLTGHALQRIGALSALRKASEIHLTIELRNEAIAALSLLDMQVKLSWPLRDHAALQPVAFDAIHKTIALAEQKGNIDIYDLKTHEKVSTLAGPGNTSAQFIRHSGTRFLAVRYEGDSVVLFDLTTSKTIRKFDGRPTPAPRAWLAFDCAFTNDEKKLAIGQKNGGATIHDTKSGEGIATIPSLIKPICLAFNKTGEFLALAGYNELKIELWHISDDSTELYKTIDLPARVRNLAWNPSGDRIAVGCWDFNIYLVEPSHGTILATLSGHRQDVTQVVFNHAGDLLCSTSRDKTIRLWDLRTNTEQVVLSGMGSEPTLSFSKDDRTLSATDFRSSIFLIDIVGLDRPCLVMSAPKPSDVATLVASVDFSPDSNRVVTSTYRAIDLWDSKKGEHLASYVIDNNQEKSASFVGDSRHLLVSSRISPPSLYEIASDRVDFPLQKSISLPIASGFIEGSLANNSNIICLTNSTTGIAEALDRSSLQKIFTLHNQPNVWDMVMNNSAHWAATSYAGSGGTQVFVWAVPNGELIAKLDAGAAGTLYLSPDGSTLITTGDLGAIVWDTHTWSRKYDIPRSVAEEALTAAFSPKGDIFSIATRQLIHLFSVRDGHPIATLETKILASHQYRVRFSPTGRYLAAQGAENSLRIWDLQTLHEQLDALGMAWTQ